MWWGGCVRAKGEKLSVTCCSLTHYKLCTVKHYSLFLCRRFLRCKKMLDLVVLKFIRLFNRVLCSTLNLPIIFTYVLGNNVYSFTSVNMRTFS